jgi:NADPH:quinone reductase-like Zn-dependent oxidoreductase
MRGGAHLNTPDPAFWEGKRTVVTGGAGFVGSAIVEMLGDLGAHPVVIRSREHNLLYASATRHAVLGADIVTWRRRSGVSVSTGATPLRWCTRT